MSTLLKIDSSPRGEHSVSRMLSTAFTATWKHNHPEGVVVERDLVKTSLPFVDIPWIEGAFTPSELHSEEMREALAISNGLVAELFNASHILLATPMYNFSTPAILKAWIDLVVRYGLTFSPNYEGLIKGKSVTVIVASGGVYTAGSAMESYDRETAYLRQILGFIGLTEVRFIHAGGTNDVAQGKKTMPKLLEDLLPQVRAAAEEAA